MMVITNCKLPSGRYQIMTMKIYFGMLSLVLVQIFGTLVRNRYHTVEICCYMFFMLLTMFGLQVHQVSIIQSCVFNFSFPTVQSFGFLHPTQIFICFCF